MKYHCTVALVVLYAITSAGVAWANETCAPEVAPTPSSLWEVISSPEVDGCITGRINEEKAMLEIDDLSVDASLRKANTILAWNTLLEQLDTQRSNLTSDALSGLIDEVYSRALAAWRSVSTTDIGFTALQHAYRSAWMIDFDGNLGSLVSDSDESEIAPKIELEAGLTKACSSEGDTCPETAKHAVKLVQRIRLGSEIAAFYGQPVIVGLAAMVHEINTEWDRFLFQSKPMYPWSLWLTDVLNRKASSFDQQLGLRRPPDTQYFILHPAPGFSYISNANDGDQLQPSVYVELFGVNKWKEKYLTGVSAIVEYSDRANIDDVGWGALFTFSNKFSFAITSNDGDVGITLGLDLANFFKEQLKPQIEIIKTRRQK